jgi:DNA polymerase-1
MGPQQHKLHAFLIDAVNMLMRVESSPLHFDLDWNSELEGIYAKKIEDSQKDIDAHVGYVLNPRSWMQIMKYFASKGMTIPTTNKDFLEKIHPLCEPEVQKFIDLILINRNLAKAYGTYVKGLRRKVKDCKIYTTFSLHATTSGRTASRKPNLQNVKRDKLIRNQFTAEPPSEAYPDGKILVQCDYSQAEGRTIADLARDSYLQQVFSDPTVDIFNDMCDRIWGPKNWNKENRVSIKSIFYGYSYGRKAKSIARELDKPVQYAVDLMNEFKGLIPDVVAWQAAIRSEVLEKQELWTPFGRKRSFHLITNENLEDVINEALSFKPQSIASDICLRAAVNLQPKLKKEFNSDIKLLIHDAIVAECLPEHREGVVELMRQEMVYSGKLYTEFVPFKVDASWGFRLGEL